MWVVVWFLKLNHVWDEGHFPCLCWGLNTFQSIKWMCYWLLQTHEHWCVQNTLKVNSLIAHDDRQQSEVFDCTDLLFCVITALLHVNVIDFQEAYMSDPKIQEFSINSIFLLEIKHSCKLSQCGRETGFKKWKLSCYHVSRCSQGSIDRDNEKLAGHWSG